MAKKAAKKKAKKRIQQNWCQMVIRVKVTKKDAKEMKAWIVQGRKDDHGPSYHLEILNAYYDMPGQPDARS